MPEKRKGKWKKLVEDSPGLTLDQLVELGIKMDPKQNPKIIRDSIKRAMR